MIILIDIDNSNKLSKQRIMKHKNIIVYIFMVILPSCAKCPGFSLNNYREISYRNKDTLIYYSDKLGTKDSLTLFVEDFYGSGESEYFLNLMDLECWYDAYYQTNDVEGTSIREYVEFTGLFEMEVQIGHDIYPFNLKYYNNNNTTVIDSINNFSVTYSYVFIHRKKYYCWTLNDLSGNRRFDSFTKMEFKGIIEFHDKETGKTWILQDSDLCRQRQTER